LGVATPLVGRADLLRLMRSLEGTSVDWRTLAPSLGFEARLAGLPVLEGAWKGTTEPEEVESPETLLRQRQVNQPHQWLCTAFTPGPLGTWIEPGNVQVAPRRPQPQAKPPRQPLRSPSSSRNLLDELVVKAGEKGRLDVPSLVRRWAAGKPVTQLPYFPCRSVAGAVWVLVDASPHLAPYQEDGRAFLFQLGTLLGWEGVHGLRTEQGALGPWESLAGSGPANLDAVPFHARVIVLSDLGRLDQGPGGAAQRRAWRQLGQRLADRGITAQVVTPAEAPDPGWRGFASCPWEATTGPRRPATQATEELLAALSLVWWADPDCVRALRHCLPGASAALEAHLLQHAALAPDVRFQRLQAGLRTYYRQRYQALPARLQQSFFHVLATFRASRTDGMVQDWEALLARHCGDTQADQGAAARFQSQLDQVLGGEPQGLLRQGELWLTCLGTWERSLLETSPLAPVAGLVQLAALRLGSPLALDPALVPVTGRTPSLQLVQTRGRMALLKPHTPKGRRLAVLEGPVILGDGTLLGPGRQWTAGPVVVRNPQGAWTFERWKRPPWATKLRREGNRLFAEHPEFKDILFVEAGPSVEGGCLPKGFWRIESKLPEWAAAAGVDAWGLWAEVRIPTDLFKSSAQQLTGESEGLPYRLRYFPPGRLAWGGPAAGQEPTPTLRLARGFWLGEMEANQFLWPALLERAPDYYRIGPTETWRPEALEAFMTEVCERLGGGFTPPTAKQWAYACRAGLQVAPSLGEGLRPGWTDDGKNGPFQSRNLSLTRRLPSHSTTVQTGALSSRFKGLPAWEVFAKEKVAVGNVGSYLEETVQQALESLLPGQTVAASVPTDDGEVTVDAVGTARWTLDPARAERGGMQWQVPLEVALDSLECTAYLHRSEWYGMDLGEQSHYQMEDKEWNKHVVQVSLSWPAVVRAMLTIDFEEDENEVLSVRMASLEENLDVELVCPDSAPAEVDEPAWEDRLVDAIELKDLLTGIEDARCSGQLDVALRGLTSDSRKIDFGWAFASLAPESDRGKQHLAHALAQGAPVVFSAQPLDLPVTCTGVVLAHFRSDLGRVARRLQGAPDEALALIGVTGTAGKTVTTALIRQLLRHAGIGCGLLNTQLRAAGKHEEWAPHSLPESPEFYAWLSRSVASGDEAMVAELSSISLALDRTYGARFKVGLLTNFGMDHMDSRKSKEEYFQTKVGLFGQCAVRLVNGDDPTVQRLLLEEPGCLSFALDAPADYQVTQLRLTPLGTDFKLTGPRGAWGIRSPLLGRSQAYNLLAALASLAEAGFDLDRLLPGLPGLTGAAGRLERVDCGQPFAVLVDYAHTPDGLEAVLLECRQLLVPGNRLHVLFGCGGDQNPTMRPQLAQVAASLAEVLWHTSDNPRWERPEGILNDAARGIPESLLGDPTRYIRIADRDRAVQAALAACLPGDVLLLAGKGDEAYQEVEGVRHPYSDRAVATAFLAGHKP